MQDRPRAVVSAATGGIGLETATGLAEAGYAVTIIGRDGRRGAEAVEKINAAAGEGGAVFVRADLSSLTAVKELGARLAAQGPLQLLVNNVGGMFVRRWETVDGLEGAFVLNHLSPLVLTEALLDALKAGKPSRIMSITSSAMAFAATGFDDVDAPGEYYGMAVTGRAKLAHLTYLLELAQMLNGTGVSVFAADPGPAATGNAADMEIDILPPQLRPHWDAIRKGVTRPVAEAARSVIFTATAPSLDGKTGLVIGQDSTPDDTLPAHLTPDIVTAAAALTERVLRDHAA
ncbi:MAG: short-chain dehydrogenase/reductase [Actinomycetia bacterium]|nr:short-chain dehydrogenase/reductase [Actinomycetes bacterium]